MKTDANDPPRRFTVKGVTIAHTADIHLDANEMVTFKTDSGSEYDVTAKSWGFYATPSLNGRLKSKGLRSALVRSNTSGRRYILLVEPDKIDAFDAYCEEQEMTVDVWLDEDA